MAEAATSFDVCLVSILGEHQRDEREIGELKRKLASFDYSTVVSQMIGVAEVIS